jgi:hypothetical protein
MNGELGWGRPYLCLSLATLRHVGAVSHVPCCHLRRVGMSFLTRRTYPHASASVLACVGPCFRDPGMRGHVAAGISGSPARVLGPVAMCVVDSGTCRLAIRSPRTGERVGT